MLYEVITGAEGRHDERDVVVAAFHAHVLVGHVDSLERQREPVGSIPADIDIPLAVLFDVQRLLVIVAVYLV